MRNPGVMPGFSFLCSKTFDIFYKLRYDIPVKAIYSWRKRVKKYPPQYCIRWVHTQTSFRACSSSVFLRIRLMYWERERSSSSAFSRSFASRSMSNVMLIFSFKGRTFLTSGTLYHQIPTNIDKYYEVGYNTT